MRASSSAACGGACAARCAHDALATVHRVRTRRRRRTRAHPCSAHRHRPRVPHVRGRHCSALLMYAITHTSARAHTHTHLQACSRARARLTLAGARVSVAREPGGGSYEPLESRVLQVQRLVNWVASELRVPVAYEHTVEKECRYRTRLGRCSASASASADDDADDGDDVVPPGVFDMDNMHCRATHVRARARARVRCAGPALTMRRCSGRA